MRWRLRVVMFLRHAARGTLFFFALLVLLRAVVWWKATARPDPSSLPYMLSWPFILGIIGGTILTALRRPSLAATAAILDQRGNTRDRLVSAQEFAALRTPTEMQRLALGETSGWLAKQDLRPLVPIRFPRELRWIAVPLATLALLWWHELDRAAQRDAAIVDARENVAPTLRSLETMANQVEKRAQQTDDAALRRIADRLKQSASQLRAEADRAGDTETAALRQIAELEQLVKELRQPMTATSDELKSLAEALRQNEESKEAARHMDENRFAEAAQALEQSVDKPDARKVEAALKEAVEHLARKNEQASKQLEDLNQEAQQPPGERQQLLKQLAKMLRELPQPNVEKEGKEQGKQPGKPQQNAGKQMKDKDLKKLLSALQQLKDQQQQPHLEESEGPGAAPGEESGDGAEPVTMLSFQDRPDADPAGDIDVPSGKPGADNERARSGSPFAEGGDASEEAQRKVQLKGELAEGESLSVLVPSASAGEAKATRRYKELTEAAAAAAEDAVLQEDIPLAARFLIKRYFQAIRPRE